MGSSVGFPGGGGGNSIVINVQFKVVQAIQNIQQLNTNIVSIGNTTQQASNSANNALQGLTGAINAVSRALLGMGIDAAVQSLLMMGNRLNQLEMEFAGFKDGVEAFKQIHDLAARTGYDFQTMADNANKLVKAGIALKDVPAYLQAFTDQGAKYKATQEEVNNAVEAFSRLASKQFVAAREFYTSFKDIGLNMMSVMEKATGMTTQQLRNAQTLKTIRTDVLMPLIVDAMARDSQGAAAKSVETNLTQAFGQLKNAVEDFAKELEAALGPAIVILLHFLTQLVQVLTELLHVYNELPESVRAVIGIVAILSATLLTLAATIGAVKAAASAAGLAEGAGLFAGLGEALPIILAVGAGLATIYFLLKELHASGVISFDIDAKIKEAKDSITSGLLTDAQRKALQGNLFAPNEQEIENAIKTSLDLLDQANKKLLLAGRETIAALNYEYAEHFRKVAVSAVATANVRIAAEKAVETEVVKHGQTIDKEIRKLELESAAVKRHIETTKATIEPDDTYAGKIRDANIEAANKMVEIDEQAQDKIRENNRLTADQVKGIWESTLLDRAKKIELVGQFEAQTIKENDALRAKAHLDEEAAALDALKKQNELANQFLEQRRDQELQNQQNLIQRTLQLREAAINAGPGATPDERVGQIAATRDAQIKAIEDARDAQEFRDRQTLERYRKLAEANAAYQNSYDELRAKQEVDHAELAKKSEFDIQMARINAWKAANEVILQDQMKVYESIKGFLGEVFDAALNQSKSFWTQFGNIIKNAMVGTVKNIVTSQLAAAATTTLGYGGFRQAPVRSIFDLGRPPIPLPIPGAPQMPGDVPLAPTNINFGDVVSGVGGASRMMDNTGGADRIMDGTGGADVSDVWRASLPPLPGTGSMPSSTGQTFGGFGRGTTAGSGFNLSGYKGLGQNLASTWRQLSSPARSTTFGDTPGGESEARALAGPGLLGALKNFGASPLAKFGAGTAGLMLANYGLLGQARGTGAGILEGTLGGAGIGFSVGGPLGAGIGAAVGLGIGVGEMAAGVETPRNQAKRLANQLYHIAINNTTADQIVNIANQSYGGSVSRAMRAPEVRHMLGLFAAGTGQSFAQGFNEPHGASLVESGGALAQQATYQYGNPYVQSSNLPTYGGVSAQTLGAPGGLNLALNIGGADAAKFMTGQVVTPDVVQTQYAAAMSGSSGRVSQALLMSPGAPNIAT